MNIPKDGQINKILTKGVSEIIEKEHLEKALKSGTKLRVKFGIDPTAPDLHLGHSVPLRKFRQFQDAGHQGILIIGDFTAKIGDPSGRDAARKQLTPKEISLNLKKYLALASKIIDVKKAKIFHNSKWLRDAELPIKLASMVSVQQVLEREDFQKRITENKSVLLLEVFYPLLQGYDSVAVKSDIEIGGIDQKLNLIMGRKLQRAFGMKEQDILTTPLLLGTDGVKKMSKSLGNYIALDEKPNEMFSKVMMIPDAEIKNYFELLTELSFESAEKEFGKPMDIKKRLASEIVKTYHGEEKAKKAKEYFEKVFSKKEIPDDIKTYKFTGETEWIDFLTAQGFAKSRSDAKRLIDGGGVEFNGVKILGSGEKIKKAGTVRIGKHKFIKIEI